jgi:hypothetical protein
MKDAFEAAGDVRSVDLLAAFVSIWREKRSGSLRFTRGGASAGYDLAEGDIVAVFSSEPRFETSAILVRAGKLDASALERLSMPPGTDAALAALQTGILTRREWKWGEKIRAIEILADLLTWADGKYLSDVDARPERGEFVLPIPRLVLELFLRSRDRNLVEHQLGPTDVPLRRSDNFDEEFSTFGLTADAESVVQLIDGGTTATEISERAPAEEFAVLKLLAALTTLGLLAPDSAALPKETEHRLRTHSGPSALRILCPPCRAAASGGRAGVSWAARRDASGGREAGAASSGSGTRVGGESRRAGRGDRRVSGVALAFSAGLGRAHPPRPAPGLRAGAIAAGPCAASLLGIDRGDSLRPPSGSRGGYRVSAIALHWTSVAAAGDVSSDRGAGGTFSRSDSPTCAVTSPHHGRGSASRGHRAGCKAARDGSCHGPAGRDRGKAPRDRRRHGPATGSCNAGPPRRDRGDRSLQLARARAARPPPPAGGQEDALCHPARARLRDAFAG